MNVKIYKIIIAIIISVSICIILHNKSYGDDDLVGQADDFLDKA